MHYKEASRVIEQQGIARGTGIYITFKGEDYVYPGTKTRFRRLSEHFLFYWTEDSGEVGKSLIGIKEFGDANKRPRSRSLGLGCCSLLKLK
jgi:hypothetical protein